MHREHLQPVYDEVLRQTEEIISIAQAKKWGMAKQRKFCGSPIWLVPLC